MTTASARPGIVCNHCYHSFALCDAGVKSDADLKALPDPFHLKCPLCGEDGAYAKSSIGRLASGSIFTGGIFKA